MTLDTIAHAVGSTGLTLRGGFHPQAEDGLPPLPGGGAGRTLLLLGIVGPSGAMPTDGSHPIAESHRQPIDLTTRAWQAFAGSPERRCADHPLDTWTRRIVSSLAGRFGALPLFPFDGPPYWPFQRWAMRAEPVAPSPLGILIHPEYGLWHAYRAALLFGETIALPPRGEQASPCETCADRPCLSACPVAAFTGSAYRVEACAEHISAPAGAMCMEEGCRARDACPVGRAYRYPPEQIRFHMAAFRRARGPAAGGEGQQ